MEIEERRRRHNEKDVGCELNHDVCFEKVIKSRGTQEL